MYEGFAAVSMSPATVDMYGSIQRWGCVVVALYGVLLIGLSFRKVVHCQNSRNCVSLLIFFPPQRLSSAFITTSLLQLNMSFLRYFRILMVL